MGHGLVAMGCAGAFLVGCVMQSFGLFILLVLLARTLMGIWWHAGELGNRERYYDALLLLLALWCLS